MEKDRKGGDYGNSDRKLLKSVMVALGTKEKKLCARFKYTYLAVSQVTSTSQK